MDDLTNTLDSIRRSLPGGGEARPSQVRMAQEVEEAILADRPAIVNAGTGTGKSIAYLVPVIMSKKPTVVVTASLALQDQLANKDLPFLAQHDNMLGKFTYSVIKGRSNYLCRQKYQEVAEGDTKGNKLFEFDQQPAWNTTPEFKRLVGWADFTETGDKADLPFEPPAQLWAAVSATSDECTGKKCPMYDSCFSVQAHRQASESDIIVSNMHLYATHIAMGGVVLPPHATVVVDEAHEFADVCHNILGAEISQPMLQAVIRKIKTVLEDPERIEALEKQALLVQGAIDDLNDLRGSRLPKPTTEYPQLYGALNTFAAEVDKIREFLEGTKPSAQEVQAKFDRVVRHISNVAGKLNMLLAANPTRDIVWREFGQPSRLKMTPLDISAQLHDEVWTEVTPILCSATIPRDITDVLGLENGHILDVGSPFDYRANGLLYVPNGIPTPPNGKSAFTEKMAYEKAIKEEISRLLTTSRGRALVLFTSWRMMQEMHEQLAPSLGHQVLIQGGAPKQVLIDEFKRDVHSILFATRSFWQGIDVVGESLSLVIIDRIPFPTPDNPIMQARKERMGGGFESFLKVDLPYATCLLAQGMGRLIRSSDDRGVVAVLDPRLAEAKYKSHILDHLPGMRRVRDFAIVETFFKESE